MENKKTFNIRSFIESFGATIFIICAILWICYYVYAGIDYGIFKSEITAYPITCKQYNEGKKDCVSGGEKLDKITFKIFSNEQYVVFTQGDRIGRLNNCIVKNRKNWTCDGYYSGKVGFTDGIYFDSSTPSYMSYVSKFDWNLNYYKK